MTISLMRIKYLARFYMRVAILIGVVVLYLFFPGSFSPLTSSFTGHFTVLHLLWALWMFDMVMQLIPSRNYMSIGSQKQFLKHFKSINVKESVRERKDELMAYIKSSNYASLKIFLVWLVLIAAIGFFVLKNILKEKELLLLSAVFYLCDIICVLFWCPFKKWFLKNRCCTTCRIFNWDHLMMFSPLAFVTSFYSLSLFLMALLVFLVWEVLIITHPERFWEGTNESLKCSHCSEYLCGKNCNIRGFKEPRQRDR